MPGPGLALFLLGLLLVISLFAGLGFWFTLKVLSYDPISSIPNMNLDKVRSDHASNDITPFSSGSSKTTSSLSDGAFVTIFCAFVLYIPLCFLNMYLLRSIFTPNNMHYVNNSLDFLSFPLTFFEMCFVLVVGYRFLRRCSPGHH